MNDVSATIGQKSTYDIPNETAKTVQSEYRDLSEGGVIFQGNTQNESTRGKLSELLDAVEGQIQLLQMTGMATEVNNGVLSAVAAELIATTAQVQLDRACQAAGDTTPMQIENLVKENLAKIEEKQPLSTMHPQVSCGLRILAHLYAWRELAVEKLASLSGIAAAETVLSEERKINHTRKDIQQRFDEILANAASATV